MRPRVICVLPPKAKRRVISGEVAGYMSKMLEDVVGKEGTAKKAAIKNYAVAGKTGRFDYEAEWLF